MNKNDLSLNDYGKFIADNIIFCIGILDSFKNSNMENVFITDKYSTIDLEKISEDLNIDTHVANNRLNAMAKAKIIGIVKETNEQTSFSLVSNNAVVEIINYLNMKTGSRYNPKTKNTIKYINARVKEGYTVDTFLEVIDKKCDEWMGTQMEMYLRPDTLFGTKFESYVNQKCTKRNRVDEVDSWI